MLERRRGGDRRRDPRRRRDEARRAPRADARAARRSSRTTYRSASACPRRRTRSRRSGASSSARGARAPIVDAGVRKPLDLKIQVPVESMVEPEQSAGDRSDPLDPSRAARRRGARSGRRSTRAARARPGSTARRSSSSTTAAAPSASRCASTSWPTPTRRRRPAVRGDRPRPPRLAGARGAHGRRGAAQGRRAAVPRRDVVARARHRHGRRRPRAPGRVAEVRRARPAAHRPRRPRRRRHLARAASSRSSAPTCSSARSSSSSCARAGSSRPSCRATRSTCSPSRSSRSPPRRARTEPVGVDELLALVTRTHSYAELPRDAARERARHARRALPVGGVRRAAPAHRLGPRRRHDPRAQGRAPARGHERRARSPTAACSRSTLPDGRRVGELDEEMVYEARPGQTFLLGASTWRIEEIGRDRVIVTPAPGAPGAVPFWRGDCVGRPEGARRGDRRVQPLGRRPGRRDARARATTSTSSPRRTSLDYLREQQDATRVVPSDRRSSSSASATRSATGGCASCRPFGGRVHAAWALALSARIRDELGLESDAIWSDDGIIVHLPDADEPPGADLVLHRPRRDRGPGRRRAGRQRAVRRALPRERGARAADPARLSRQAHAAVAAAAEVAVAARGRQALRATSR